MHSLLSAISDPLPRPLTSKQLERCGGDSFSLINIHSVVFSKCDVTSWEDQVELFKFAKAKSPSGGIDVVIANAGVYGPDILDGKTLFSVC